MKMRQSFGKFFGATCLFFGVLNCSLEAVWSQPTTISSPQANAVQRVWMLMEMQWPSGSNLTKRT